MGKPPLSKAIFPVSQSMRDQIPKGDSFGYGSQGRESESRDISLNEGFGENNKGTGGGSKQEIPDKRAPGGGRRY